MTVAAAAVAASSSFDKHLISYFQGQAIEIVSLELCVCVYFSKYWKFNVSIDSSHSKQSMDPSIHPTIHSLLFAPEPKKSMSGNESEFHPQKSLK